MYNLVFLDILGLVIGFFLNLFLNLFLCKPEESTAPAASATLSKDIRLLALAAAKEQAAGLRWSPSVGCGMILTLMSGVHVDADVWAATIPNESRHPNDGSDRTALINEPGLGSSISLSEAKPQKKPYWLVWCHLGNR